MSLSIPFDEALLHHGLHIRLAAKLFEEGVSTLVDAAKIANTPLESFIQKLGAMGIAVVDYEANELDQELKILGK